MAPAASAPMSQPRAPTSRLWVCWRHFCGNIIRNPSERLASYGVKAGSLSNILQARNLTVGGGEMDAGGKTVFLHPSGEFHSEREIGNVIVGTTARGVPLYLRDVADIARSYQNPARYL